MKILLSILTVIITSQAQALEFSLDCKDHDDKALPLKVVKVPKKSASGKWENFFFVEALVSGQLVRAPLEHAGSGDEDYNEFRTTANTQKVRVQGAAIQNRFKWASLTNLDGYSFAHCQ